MAGRSNFVSIGLVITLFILPVGALSGCWIQMPAMRETAMGDAGMTTIMPPVSIQQVTVSGSCCELSAADTPPISVPRAPERGATDRATNVGTFVFEVPPAFTKAQLKAPPCGYGSSLQAALCVFLI
jgi:hypothetical protein